MTDRPQGADAPRGRRRTSAGDAATKGARKRGRPRLELDAKDMKRLVGLVEIHCTFEECAAVLGISEDTLDRRLKERGFGGFSDFFRKHTAAGRASLRRMQWALAKKGNVTAQIWLGKQHLGQRDFVRQELSGPDGGPIRMIGATMTPQEAAEAYAATLLSNTAALGSDEG